MRHHIKTLMLLSMLIITFTLPAFTAPRANQSEPITAKDIQEFETMYSETVKKPGAAVVQEQANVARITVPGERAIYYFAQKGNPAYPSVIIRKVVENNGAVSLETNGDSWGDQDIFKAWMQQFVANDNNIKNQAR